MYKKISGIALALMLSVSNFVNAENWIETTTELICTQFSGHR